jgi:predicted nuclease of restriction endonuclease-like RecB superfamily
LVKGGSMICYINRKSFIKKPPVSSQGWRCAGEKSFFARSKWEANYGKYLQWLKKNHAIRDWEHEPQEFWFFAIKRGVRSYKPDFKVTNNDGSHYWVEVKGFMDPKSKTKIARMKKYYPDEKLVLVCGKWFKENNKKLRPLVEGWE